MRETPLYLMWSSWGVREKPVVVRNPYSYIDGRNWIAQKELDVFDGYRVNWEYFDTFNEAIAWVTS
jgi:hypothetical protein